MQENGVNRHSLETNRNSHYTVSTITITQSENSSWSQCAEHSQHGDCDRCQSVLRGWSWWRVFLLLVDNVVSALLIGPLTVFYWCGTWSLLERHWLPDYQVDSNGKETVVASVANGWICCAVGNVGLLILVFAQGELSRRVKIDRMAHWLFGCHLYTYTLAFFNVCHWRGVWILLNLYTGSGAVSAWTTFAIGSHSDIQHAGTAEGGGHRRPQEWTRGGTCHSPWNFRNI
jgi:Fuseless